MADIGKAYVQIIPTAEGISGKIEQELGGAGTAAGHSFSKGFGKVLAGAAVAGTAAVSAFAKKSISAGADFDSAMAQVAATMGTTVDKIGNLRDFAQEMGSTTAFSATEAADALNYMALAGYDAETSMKMLPNVLNLAAAGGIDLASASDMVTDAQTALGLSLDETSAMVDQMAKASSKSNTSVQQLGEAFLTIGANARGVAGGTEELSTVLGVLADNGIKGTEAGTHLRNIMLAMNPTTDKAAAAWKELGVEAYDAEGDLRSLPEIFQELNDAMDGWSEQDRTEMLSAMFNKTDLASIQALLGTTGDRYEELAKAIGDADGAAQAMANTQLDNLEGDITLFKSALEGAQIAISDQLTPTLRDFVSFGAEGLGQLTQAFQEGGLDGMMSALGTLLADGLNMIIEKLPTVIEAGMKLVAALGQGIIQNLPTILKSAIDIIMILAQGLIEALPNLLPAVTDIIIQLAFMLTEPDMLVHLIDAALRIILALVEGLIAAIPQLIQAVPQIIVNIISTLIDALPKIIEMGVNIVLTLAEGILKTIPAIVKTVIDLWNKLKETWTNKIGDVKQWGKDLIDNFINGIKEKWEAFKQTLSDLAGTVKDFLGFSEPKEGPLSNFHTFAPDMMDLFMKGVEDKTPELDQVVSQSFDLQPVMAQSMANGDGRGSETNVTVTLQGDASKFFTVMRDQNNIFKKMNGQSAFA
jgi:TP901 family phage tail tape measure protein